MVLLIEGQNRIRDLIADDLYLGMFGSDATIETPSDTTLLHPYVSTYGTPTYTTKDRYLIIDHTLSSTTTNGSTLREFQIRLGTAGGSYGLTRVTFTGLPKQNTEQWQTSTILYLD